MINPSIDFHINRNFNHLQEQIQQPLFKEFYLCLCGAIVISTKIFTSVNPTDALVFIHVAYLIDQVAAAIFASELEEHRQTSLIPASGQFGHLAASAIASNIICAIFFRSLSISQMFTMGVIFLVSVQVAKKAILHFKNQQVNIEIGVS